MIYAVFLCVVAAGRIDPSSCQMLQESSTLSECRLTVANQTRGVDLSHAPTRMLCMQRAATAWQEAH